MKKQIIQKIAGDTDFVGGHITTSLGNFRHDRNLEHGNLTIPGQYLQNLPNNIFRLRLKNQSN